MSLFLEQRSWNAVPHISDQILFLLRLDSKRETKGWKVAGRALATTSQLAKMPFDTMVDGVRKWAEDKVGGHSLSLVGINCFSSVFVTFRLLLLNFSTSSLTGLSPILADFWLWSVKARGNRKCELLKFQTTGYTWDAHPPRHVDTHSPQPLVVKLCNTQENTCRILSLVSCYTAFTELLWGSCGTGKNVAIFDTMRAVSFAAPAC